ncbi:MAG: ATP-binding protein [Candidatus Aquicultor sp.]|nr:ATP-binding protein [Candidatus Aquicultor sp.]
MCSRKYDRSKYRCKRCILHNSVDEFAIGSESSNLVRIRDHIYFIGNYCELDEKQLFDLQVAVGEAAANAIEHGSPLGRENTVRLKATCDSEYLTVTIKDEGRFRRCVHGPNGDEVNFRGRGIPLMLALMEKVAIDEAKDGTCVMLVTRVARNGHISEEITGS